MCGVAYNVVQFLLSAVAAAIAGLASVLRCNYDW